ncbi:MAG: glucose 1-dehydrogenase [Nitrospira sp.]|jgi:threonine dehydrogenase-like Zn-dependent dehydrogenase|nr:glucose 1-dehydrogenase [Nitrospira sp.]MDI3464611.1 Glucose 1-dehydrogenase [Nitrospira sp.]
MKAVAVVPGTREIQIVDHPVPRLSTPTDVRLRVLEVGVCGTDKEISTFEYGTPPSGSNYLVLGHESLAEIVEVGPEVSHYRVGDLVVVMVRRPCWDDRCLPCRSERQDFCTTGGFMERGIKEAHGFMTEFVVEQERYLIPIPRALRQVAVLIEPLTIAEKALAQLRQVQQRLPWSWPSSERKPNTAAPNAVVLGAGPVGLLGAMALVAAGFRTYVYSRSRLPNQKAGVAEAIGATYVSSEAESVEQLAKRVGNIDVVFEAVGSSDIAFELVKVLGTNGVFIFTGVPRQKAPAPVETDRIMKNLVLKNQLLLGTVNAGRDTFEAAVQDLERFTQRWPQAVQSLLTGRYRMEEFRDVVLGRTGGIKEVITVAA